MFLCSRTFMNVYVIELYGIKSKFKQRTALSHTGETCTQHTVAVNCTDVRAVT